tara:strand:+ start:412 stop:615 length:204 start_codon:yes stop_codon:yes gene_type:complete
MAKEGHCGETVLVGVPDKVRPREAYRARDQAGARLWLFWTAPYRARRRGRAPDRALTAMAHPALVGL